MGLYAIAILIVFSARGTIVGVVRTVSLPALSEIVRLRPHDLRRVYYEFRLPVDIVSGFFIGFLFVCGQNVINILYNESFHGAGVMVQILSISLLDSRYILANQCFVAFGKPQLRSHVMLVRLIVVYSLLPLAYGVWGLEGALWVAGGSGLFAVPLILYFKHKLGFLSLRKELLVIPPILFGYMAGLGFNASYEVIAGVTG